MDIKDIDDATAYFARLGELHDVEIANIDISAQTLKIAVDDINANFEGLADYQGGQSAVLTFRGVTALHVDVDVDEGLRISQLQIASDSLGLAMVIHLNVGGGSATGGCSSITAKFKSLKVEYVQPQREEGP